MTNRELLEAAAKAAGILVKWEPTHEALWIEPGQGLVINIWNPLADDAQNRQLQIKLKIPLQFPDWQDIAKTWGPQDEGEGYVEFATDHNGNLGAAVRLAIVRAAAAMAG